MKDIEQSIYEEIVKHDDIRWSALKRIIIDEKKITSDRIFRLTVNRMTKNNILVRKEISKQHVEYTTQPKIDDKSFWKFIMFLIFSGVSLNMDRFRETQKKMKKSEQVKCAKLIFNLINQLGLFLTIDNPLSSNEINKYRKIYIEFFESLISIIDHTKKPEQLWNLVLSEWTDDISNQMNQLHEILKK